jgi:uncharacterized protein DUF6869
MSLEKATRLAAEWIAYWEHRFSTGKFPPSDYMDDLDDAVHESPDLAWQAIKLVVGQIKARAHEDRLVEVLAAGPVEDLLRLHGPAVIDRVENEARRDPAFNNVLGGVWSTTIDPDVWERVEHIRNKVW